MVLSGACSDGAKGQSEHFDRTVLSNLHQNIETIFIINHNNTSSGEMGWSEVLGWHGAQEQDEDFFFAHYMVIFLSWFLI